MQRNKLKHVRRATKINKIPTNLALPKMLYPVLAEIAHDTVKQKTGKAHKSHRMLKTPNSNKTPSHHYGIAQKISELRPSLQGWVHDTAHKFFTNGSLVDAQGKLLTNISGHTTTQHILNDLEINGVNSPYFIAMRILIFAEEHPAKYSYDDKVGLRGLDMCNDEETRNYYGLHPVELKGKMTIGPGVNLTDMTPGERNELSPVVDLEHRQGIRDGTAATHLCYGPLSDSEIDRLLLFELKKHMEVLRKKLVGIESNEKDSNKLTAYQIFALLDLTYNQPRLLGIDMHDALLQMFRGKRDDAVINEILQRCNGGESKGDGIQKRRVLEAIIFSGQEHRFD